MCSRLEYREAVKNMKNSSTLEKSLFIPSYLDDSEPTLLLEIFTADQFLFFLYICLKQANDSYYDQKDFYRTMYLQKKAI